MIVLRIIEFSTMVLPKIWNWCNIETKIYYTSTILQIINVYKLILMANIFKSP